MRGKSQSAVVRVNLYLTQLTHSELKAWCARKRITMQEGITALIETGVAAPKSVAAPARNPGVPKNPNIKPGFTVDWDNLEIPAEPAELPWATREDAKHGAICCDTFRIPDDWYEETTGEPRTRAQAVADGEGDDACIYWYPPELTRNGTTQ